MQPSDKPFVLYPFGKLYPIIPELTQFLALKKINFVENWKAAGNSDDLDSMLSLVTISNYWKESELHYRVPKQQIKIFGSIRYDMMIISTFDKLKKNDLKANRKVCMVLGQLLSFFYTKFDCVQKFKTYSAFLFQLIQNIQKYMVITPFLEQNQKKQKQFTQQLFISWIQFLQPFDGIEKDNMRKEIERQIRQMIEYAFERNSCACAFLQVLIYLRLQFLQFFEYYYEQEWNQYVHKQEGRRNNRTHKDQTTIDTSTIQTNMRPLEQQMRFLYRTSLRSMSNPNKLFCFIHPLIQYLPKKLIQCKSRQERQYVFYKLYQETFQLLLKLYGQEKKTYDQEYKRIKQIKQLDLIKAFRMTTLLNDIQISLVAFQQDEIRQHKQVEDYKSEYQQILQYFRTVETIKRKIIQKIQQYYHSLTLKQNHMSELDKKRQEKYIKYIQKSNDTQKKQQVSQPFTLQVDKPVQINKDKIVNKRDRHTDQQNSDKYKQKPNKQQKNKDIMKSILQKQDEQTQYEQENLKQGTNGRSDHNQSHNKTRIQQKSQEKRQVRVTKKTVTNKQPQQYRKGKLFDFDPSEASSNHSSQQLESYTQQIGTFDYQYFVTYYHHHYHPYQMREIFREKHQLTNHANEITRQFRNVVEIRYPKFIDLHLYNPQIIKKQIFKKQKNKMRANTQFLVAQKQKFIRKNNKIQALQSQISKSNSRNSSNINHLKNQYFRLTTQLGNQSNEFGNRLIQICNAEDTQQKIYICMFPLSQSYVGRETVKKLAKHLQNFIQKYMQKFRVQKEIENPFFPGLFPQHNSQSVSKQQNPAYLSSYLFNAYRYDLNKLSQDETTQYFLGLLYDLLNRLQESRKSAEHSNSHFIFFHESLFSKLDLSLQMMLIYFMYQFQKNEHLKLQRTLTQITQNTLTNKQLIYVLRGLAIDLKLQNKQMNNVYFKLYRVLSESLLAVFDQLVGVLFQCIVPGMEQFYGKARSNRTYGQGHSIQTDKQAFYEHFTVFIDLFYLWMLITFGTCSYALSKQINVNYTSRPARRNVAFYCPYCSGFKFLQFSPSYDYNFQNSYCQQCSNSFLYRFQLHQCEQRFVFQSKKIKYKLQNELYVKLKTIKKQFSRRHWNVNQLTYHNYEKLGNLSQKNNMEVDNQETFQEKIKRKHQGNNNQQKSLSQNLKKNPNYMNCTTNKKLPAQKGNKSNKTDFSRTGNTGQNKIIKQHEEFCYNNCKILQCYINYVQKLLRQA